MSASILQFRSVFGYGGDWSDQEIAEFARVASALTQSGLEVATDRGLTDEAEPWFVFFRPSTEEVIAHFARIDGEIIADASAVVEPVRGRDLRHVLDQIAARYTVFMPSKGSNNLFMHPAALLTAFVATALLELDSAAAARGEPNGDADRSSRGDGAAPRGLPVNAVGRAVSFPDAQSTGDGFALYHGAVLSAIALASGILDYGVPEVEAAIPVGEGGNTLGMDASDIDTSSDGRVFDPHGSRGGAFDIDAPGKQRDLWAPSSPSTADPRGDARDDNLVAPAASDEADSGIESAGVGAAPSPAVPTHNLGENVSSRSETTSEPASAPARETGEARPIVTAPAEVVNEATTEATADPVLFDNVVLNQEGVEILLDAFTGQQTSPSETGIYLLGTDGTTMTLSGRPADGSGDPSDGQGSTSSRSDGDTSSGSGAQAEAGSKGVDEATPADASRFDIAELVFYGGASGSGALNRVIDFVWEGITDAITVGPDPFWGFSNVGDLYGQSDQPTVFVVFDSDAISLSSFAFMPGVVFVDESLFRRAPSEFASEPLELTTADEQAVTLLGVVAMSEHTTSAGEA